MRLDLPVVVAEEPDGSGQELEFDAFLLGVMDFLDARGHLGLGAAVDDVDLLGAESEGGAHGSPWRCCRRPDDGDVLAR